MGVSFLPATPDTNRGGFIVARGLLSITGSRPVRFRDSPFGKRVVNAGRKKAACKIARTTCDQDIGISNFPGTQLDPPTPPLISALKAAAEVNAASFHFPGHNRGLAAPSSLVELIGVKPFLHDLPELENFASEPILDAEKLAAELFGASDCWFLVGGTTSGIQAAILATCSPGDTLILPRNSHISAISALVLSGAVPKYVIPDYDLDWEIAGAVSSSQVENAIDELKVDGQKAAAVFVTSPTYHGICSNLKEIAEVCHSRDIPLIVDEAHGAHFGFHRQLPSSALQQGADLTVQSTHKVLCSLTQSSMLLMSGRLVDKERICRCLQTLQSTSPSPLLLASLDAARAELSKSSDGFFDKAIQLANEAIKSIKQIRGVSVLDSASFSQFPVVDPLRLTVGVSKLGLSGCEADQFLSTDQNVVCEMIGSRSITFAFTPGTCREHVQRLVLGFKHLSSSTFVSNQNGGMRMDHNVAEPFRDIRLALNPREAFFAVKRKVGTGESMGKVCGELICPYPPGIPAIVPGEIITNSALDYLLRIKSMGGLISGASDPSLTSIVICDV
ncbi:hypothetical protein Dimus_010883 [Dionaea muscipula]